MALPSFSDINVTTIAILKHRGHTHEANPIQLTELRNAVLDDFGVPTMDKERFRARFNYLIRDLYYDLRARAKIREVGESLTYWHNRNGRTPDFG